MHTPIPGRPRTQRPSATAIVAGGAIWVSLGLLLFLGGCASSGGTTTAVAGTKIALTAAEKAATLYSSQPQCGPTHPAPFCSELSLITQIKQADNAAYAAVMAARSGGDSATLDTANAAVAALVSLIPAATVH